MSLKEPPEFQCRRCGYCCKHYGVQLDFQDEDIERWEDEDWVWFHPFIDWDLKEFLSPLESGYWNMEAAKEALIEAEEAFYKDTGVKPRPFPWGGTLRYCTFLKWMGNKWGCLIHDIKSNTCKEYNCYWNRV